VTLWDWTGGKVVQSLAVREGDVHVAEFSPDGRWLAAAVQVRGKDGAVIVRDLQTGREAFALQGLTGFISCLAFSPDGQRLAGGTAGFGAGVRMPNFVKVRELRTGQVVLKLNAGFASLVALAFSPYGNRSACTAY
jgi:WD40 repeat protein